MLVTSNQQDRARRLRYQAALDALNVAHNPRYRANQRGADETYCNLFVADATLAMAAPVPLFVDGAEGQRTWWGVDEMIDWLAGDGAVAGWRAVPAEAAQALANRGYPVVAAWHNPAGTGHLAMVRPGPEPAGPGGPRIAQAGSLNAADIDVATGFGGGAERLAAVCYYANAPVGTG
jgi:hypothetical protein